LKSHFAEYDTDYGYTAKSGTCHYKKTTSISDSGYTNVKSYSVAQLKAAVAQGPTSVTIEADRSAFQRYTGGILNTGCGTQLDHAVICVGYGVENGQEYFLVRNSWGASWGLEGHIKLAATAANSGAGVCGILEDSLYPTFAK